jgi:putative phosphoesterase
MKIAIVSDSHDNQKNIEKFVAYIKKNPVDAIIHCGDMCRSDSLDIFLANFSGKFYLSLGNGDMPHDFDEYKTNPNIEIFPRIGILDLPELNIAFAHYKDMVKSFSKKCKFIFYGHSHKPWLEMIGEPNLPVSQQSFIACPGNLAGIYYAPTFAIFDTITQKLELKILDKI